MPESLVELAQTFRAALISFQPEAYSGQDCAALVEELAAVEKVSAFARVWAAARVGECGAHRERGFADVSDWLARATGSTAGAAKSAPETAAALESQPEARAALAAGELSFAQARELVKAGAAVRRSTAALLDVAKNESLRTLKEKARDRQVRAVDPGELRGLQHAAMYHRHWTTGTGPPRWATSPTPASSRPSSESPSRTNSTPKPTGSGSRPTKTPNSTTAPSSSTSPSRPRTPPISETPSAATVQPPPLHGEAPPQAPPQAPAQVAVRAPPQAPVRAPALAVHAGRKSCAGRRSPPRPWCG